MGGQKSGGSSTYFILVLALEHPLGIDIAMLCQSGLGEPLLEVSLDSVVIQGSSGSYPFKLLKDM